MIPQYSLELNPRAVMGKETLAVELMAEGACGNIFQIVGFINHHGVEVGQNASFRAGIGQQHGLVSDDNMGLGQAVAQAPVETALEMGTALLWTAFFFAAYFGPQFPGDGEGDFAVVSRFSLFCPALQCFYVM